VITAAVSAPSSPTPGEDQQAPLASAPVLSALLVTGGGALVALLASRTETLPDLVLACGALIGGTGLALARGSRWSRPLAAIGVGVGLWSARAVLVHSPDFALLFGVAALTILQLVWSVPRRNPSTSWRATFTSAGAAKSGAVSAGAAWVALAITESTYPPLTLLGAGSAFAAATVFLLAWLVRSARLGVRGLALPLGCSLLGVAAAVGLNSRPTWALSAWAVGLGLAILFVPPEDDAASPWSIVLEHPARLIATSFAGLCTLGALVLALPVSARSTHGIGLLDAAFTAVSAGCVTGLSVLDAPRVFSDFGQAVLLVLIQVGGLGIMTFYTVALRALGRRLGLKHEIAITEAALVNDQSSLYLALGKVLALTFSSELCGAAALAACFRHDGLEWPEALWKGLFTSVSAFCNAGFALDTLSLVPYQKSPLVLGIVGCLIVIGGLAPAVVLSLPAWLAGRVVALHTKLAAWMALTLLVFGFLSFLAFEWSSSLVGLPWWHKLTNAAFQSVTLRTAGFNSVNLADTSPATQQIMMALMFVGGSPGGTAGGVKTTTVALLLLAVLAALRGQSDVLVLGRRVMPSSVYRAAAVATVAVLGVMGVLLSLLLTQPLTPAVAMFETVSALGTVGLSIGGTGMLDGIGKVIVAAAMFMGRVGPLTLVLLLGERRERSALRYPDAEVDVG
jgi:trk system potassium uptake protein TrkH